MKIIIEKYCKLGYFNRELKNSVHDYLVEARSIKSEDYEYRVNLINEIISILNSSPENISSIFYRSQLAKRKDNKKYLYGYLTDVIEKEIPDTNRSICNDAIVLLSHAETTSDEDFIQGWLPDLTLNLFYYESINTILDECPEMFKNQTFYNRFICVLNRNNELSKNETYKTNKKFVKEVNRKIKKV